MDTKENVFKPHIVRVQTTYSDDLYNLFRRSSAVPVKKGTNELQKSFATCDFQPRKDKYYVSKRKSKLKVKTVRDIRQSFEKDVYEILPVELEKQQNYFFRKIKSGFLHDESTKTHAKILLKSKKSISRSAWQMLMNINPGNNIYPIQYVLCNGIQIKINGSKGGSTKFLYTFDLSNKPCKSDIQPVRSSESKKKNLLQTSVNIKFKPGPLSKKRILDCSYQKHQFGETKVIKLPNPVLEVYPSHGHSFNASLTSYLHNIRNADGVVSQNWAELAAAAVGTLKNGKLVKNPPAVVQLPLSYQNDRKNILMRNNDIDSITNLCTELTNPSHNESFDEIKNMLNEMITSIEISLEQNNLLVDDEPRLVSPFDINLSSSDGLKDKSKKRYGALQRLDVTVIQLSDEEDCKKSFCTLGCICSSLRCFKNVKTHCGRTKCMFECKCNFTKYAYKNCPKLLSQLVGLENDSKLAKEEKKFHQTVVVTKQETILLKNERKIFKMPKKYENLCQDICLKNKEPPIRPLSIVCQKLNCDNIEPWCMVHNLYKCFCDGKFSDSNISVKVLNVIEKSLENGKDFISTQSNKCNTVLSSDNNDDSVREYSEKCSRVIPNLKRKHSSDHYKEVNRKIVELESKDAKLHNRLLHLAFKCQIDEKSCEEGNKSATTEPIKVTVENLKRKENQTNLKEKYRISHIASQETIVLDDSDSELADHAIARKAKEIKGLNKDASNCPTLVKWLETSYKKYKEDIEKGVEKTSLEPPKAGLIVLHSWAFIYDRYRCRKNLFLVSKSPPYRIVIAVSIKHAMFENFINIDEIRFADLHKYPATVKNLLINDFELANNFNNTFLIFRGLSTCWELIGSACRIDEKSKHTEILNDEDVSPKLSFDDDDNLSSDSHNNAEDVSQATDSQNVHNAEVISKDNFTESSKWFVMTIENDFSEIQFYKKGFFVKYESIIKAIHVSRSSGNTVRLSSQQKAEHSASPHFGIYAIPNAEQYCVFIGPYEKDEPLGIETVKKYSDNVKKNTRGVWITTNKVDDFKVIDNPLYFMPSLSKSLQNEIHIDNVDTETVCQPISTSAIISENHSKPEERNKIPDDGSPPKKIKRILIRKTKGGYFKVMPKDDSCENPQNQTKSVAENSGFHICVNGKTYTASKKPVAEIAPQVKDVCTKIGRISILSQDQINQKFSSRPLTEESLLQEDIENFLATSVICASPDSKNVDSHVEIWIECKSVQGLGYIKGKMRADSFISFDFPGFKSSPFYDRNEAIEKINQVLTRKVYVPKHIKLEWDIVNTIDQRTCKTMLKSEDLGADVVLTKQGLMHKKLQLCFPNQVSPTETAVSEQNEDAMEEEEEMLS